jgi:hypothetical protein
MDNKILSEQLDIQEKDILFEFDPKKYESISNNYNYSYLYNIYIKLNLPAIYSSSERQFRWIKYLGYNIIDKIRCKISFLNSTNITEINLYTYSEWLFIWYEINLDASEKELHYNLIGHIPELYDPALHNNNIYPTSHLQKHTYKWIIDDNNLNKATFITITNDYNFNKPPSINSKTLYIPLNFCFCNNISNILPLNKIKKINFIINFKDYNQLYNILLQPEDFVLASDTNTHLSNSNFNNSYVIPSDTIFINNNKTIFSSNKHIHDDSTNISIFDTLLNDYRIIPSKKGLTSINRFILNQSANIYNVNNTNLSISDSLLSQNNYTKNNFYNICNPYILFSIIFRKIYEKNYIKINGILNDITTIQFNPQIIPNISNDNLTGYIDDYNIELKLNNKTNYISEIFFVFKHNKRNLKNDFLNFTNYDYNNMNLWNNNIKDFKTNINIISNSFWDNLYTYNDIKLETNSLGRFSIKKKIKDNNIIKFINILEYQTNLENNNNTTILNSKSYKYYNENIIDNFIIEMKYSINKSVTYTYDKETYDFYNKLTLYKYYKSTVPGLYHLNFSNKYIKNINNLLINNSTVNTLNIDNDNIYNIYLFIIDNKKITFN